MPSAESKRSEEFQEVGRDLSPSASDAETSSAWLLLLAIKALLSTLNFSLLTITVVCYTKLVSGSGDSETSSEWLLLFTIQFSLNHLLSTTRHSVLVNWLSVIIAKSSVIKSNLSYRILIIYYLLYLIISITFSSKFF